MDLVVGVKHTLLTIELMSKLASKLPSLAGGKFLLGLIDVHFAISCGGFYIGGKGAVSIGGAQCAAPIPLH